MNAHICMLLSKQPWASLLVYGIKRIEGRSWPTQHRGRLWIHATSQKPTDADIRVGCASCCVSERTFCLMSSTLLTPRGACAPLVCTAHVDVNRPLAAVHHVPACTA